MHISRFLKRFFVPVILMIVLVLSCKKENQQPSYSYFVSKEQKLTLSTTYINNFINSASGLYPEVNSLKQYVSNDVTIYKLIYKTTISGEEILASGLVCVPSIAGEYPVLSFQNGTNTLNSLAPSNNVLDPAYQMVEIIASMGFIVVLADYPGFGESAQIPHPYLIKESTVQSLVDMLFTIKEIAGEELQGIIPKNEYYLLGYSQGGWATLALHKALEIDYPGDFNLVGSACGSGPYNIFTLFQGMAFASIYSMPVYLGYIVNAFSSYHEFTNPVTEIFNDPYAARLGTLFNGNLSPGQINLQLTTSIPGLLKTDFISGFIADPEYSSVRNALSRNSITGWDTHKSLYLLHGANDSYVNPVATENMYNEMINAGTSAQILKKEIIPGLDHNEGVVPCMIKGLLYLKNL